MKCISIVLALALLGGVSACGPSSSKTAPKEPSADHEEADHEDGGHAEGQVALTPEQLKNASIEVATVGPASIRETLSLYGVISPNAERMREVSARFPGILREVRRKIGDTVKQGETLATIESNESLQTYALSAPLSGVVTQRNANEGEQTGEKTLFTVADLSTVWVELSLFPRDRPRVHVGQGVRVRSTEAGLSADGEVVYVAPFGSATSQTLTARVQLDNAQGRWAPGLYVNAEVTLAEAPAALTIRNDAVQSLEGRDVVFVEEGANTFEPRPVRLGRTDGERCEVVEGLKAGDRYVSRNSFAIKSQIGAGSAGHEH
jgi:cobalt-zinc-cadmium efflux system membrane fusion protein